MAQQIARLELNLYQFVEVFSDGHLLITDGKDDPFLPTFTELDAAAGCKLFDFLLRYMERVVQHAGNEPGSSDDIDRVAGYRRVLESGGTLDDPTGPAFP